MIDLNDTAAQIVKKFRANGFEDDGGIRQVLALAEEAGEMVGAYRRWTGRARRTGTADEFRAELADVVITAYVTAAEQGARLAVIPVRFMYREPSPENAWPAVLDVFEAVNVFVNDWRNYEPAALSAALEQVVYCARQLATVLDIDLDAAVEAKLGEVFTRGWREK